MVTNPLGLWLAVVYTWILILVAIPLRMWVLMIVGIERSGSTLSAASLVHNAHSPLNPLVERGYMHAKGDFDDDMDAESEVWRQDLKLGVLPNETYGIGKASKVRSLGRHRNQGEVVYGSVDDDESDTRMKSDVETVFQDVSTGDVSGGETTGLDHQRLTGGWS